MWSKLNSVLKRQTNEESEPSQADVLSGVLEKHPNLSMFHTENDLQQASEVPFPIPSPPSSPSKNGRRGLLKRMSRGPKLDLSESIIPAPLKSPLQKVKSHITLAVNASQTSLHSPHEPITRRSSDTARPSIDSAMPPTTPVDGRFGSLRSIMRDRNTPATGQSVRFFSRDAYKVISPDVSAASEAEDPCFVERLHLNNASSQSEISRTRPPASRPLAQDLFSPAKASSTPPGTPADATHTHASLMQPLPPPDISNIFDLSQRDLPSIPADLGGMLDNAVEIFEGDESKDGIPSLLRDERSAPSPLPRFEGTTVFHSMDRSSNHDRSQSFSFGETVFRAMPKATEDSDRLSAGALADSYPGRPPSRNRAMSDTVFHSALRSPKVPEADINDMSSSALVLYSTPNPERERERPQPDPFSAHATTYYTPGTMMPPTPPQPTHARRASREEDLIMQLQTQITLQQELCAQYEVDLGAKDELVDQLTARLEAVEKDNAKRRSTIHGWKKKVQELERMCRHLEDEAESSRQESFERSIMDEASGEALRQLHRQISELEREKNDILKRVDDSKDGRLKESEEEVARLKELLRKKEDGERLLKEGIRNAQEQIEQMGTGEGEGELRAVVVQREHANEEQREMHRLAELQWDEERAHLLTGAADAEKQTIALQEELDRAREELHAKDEEMGVLRSELEAQWKSTEQNGERMEELKQEKDTLQGELVALEAKVETMELEWNEGENRRAEVENELQEVYAAKEELEREKAQFEEDLRAEQEHAEQLTRALQEREDRVESLQQELKFAVDNASRLEQNVRQRDGEVEELAHRIVAGEDDAEEAREELSRLKREKDHDLDEQRRTIADLMSRNEEERTQLEAAVREKAEADVAASSLRERVHVLEEEVEKLRRQVHQLKAESADKDMRMAQMEKQRDRDREDLQGLNIALDSKQQELELIKRRLSVKGTAGATPVANKTVHHRRESSVFTTPSVSRPASRLSDASRDAAKITKPEAPANAARLTTLGKSVRANGPPSTPSAASKVASTSSTTIRPTRSVDGAMGPPPVKPRPSVATPTPAHSRIPSSSLARSGTKPPSTPTLRRPASATAAEAARSAKASAPPTRDTMSPQESELDEKENTEPESDSLARHKTLVAA